MRPKARLRRWSAPLEREEWTVGPTLLAGLVFGAATGLLEIGPIAVARQAGYTIRMSRHYLWMTPVADVTLFLAVALGLALLGLAWHRARSRSVILGVLSGLGIFCLLLLAEPIHDLASLLLAAGVGVQVGRRATGSRTRRVLRAVPPAAPVLLLAVGALAWWSVERDAARERAQLAAAPPAASDAPNVLLLILDTVRAGSMELYGGPGGTSPVLSALARRGVLFERAIAPAPWTLPTHASMFTGRWPHRLDVDWSPLGPDEPTLAERLGSEGYATAGFVGNTLYASRASGLDRGFGVYEDYPVSVGQIVLSSSLGRALAYSDAFRRLVRHHELLNRQHARDVNRDFLTWLEEREERGEDRPWFAFLNYYEAHEPYFPPDSVLGDRSWNDFSHRGGILVGGNSWRDKEGMTREDVQIHAYAYHLAVRRADAGLGRLMEALAGRGLLENTLVVVASDHGEQLGEHALFGHTNSLFINTLHVPMVMLWPGRLPEGRRISGAASLRDLPATILELVGAEATLPGRSLAPELLPAGGDAPSRSPAVSHLTKGPEPQPNTPIGRGDAMQSIVRLPYHYIRNGDGSDALYDLSADPHELDNLAGTSDGNEALVPLRARLYEIITGRPAPEEMPIRPYRPTDRSGPRPVE